ncbi:MAG: hypothetical protein D6746_13195 [Bacteroidetes bacterium]|nr:MAG: hypothetical protein D6746_13195 [Bacteroidota bacterium]
MPASKVEQYSTVRPLLSEDVRLLNDQFKPIQGKSRFVSEAVAVGQDFIRELNAALKSAGFKSAERLEILKDLKRELGRTENGKFSGAVFSLNLLDATPDQLSNTLNAVIPLTATGRGSALQTAFFKLVDRYGKRLRALEERMLDSGILTQRLADRILDQDADAIRRLAEKVGNRFLVVIDRSTGRLHIISGSRTVDELTRQLEILARRANPVKGGYVFLHGTDGSVARRATEIFGKAQLIPGAPKKAPRLFATKRMKRKLAEANIFVNPEVPKEKISKAELTVRRATGRPFIWSSIGSSFVVTPSGELIVSAVHPSPSQLAKRLWGQGPWYVHEMGTVTKEGIVLSNVLGFPGFDRLDKTALQFLKKRLQKIAQRLDKAGFRRDTPMHIVLAGVPPEVRKELFGSHLTLGEMLSKEFDLRLPEEHLGIDLSGAVPVGVDALKDVPSRGTLSGAAQRVLKQIAASFDKNIFEEVRAGIPVQYRDGYYARILNPAIREDAKDLLDDMWMKFLKSDKAPKQLKQTWQRFGFTKRRYSDLTFEEINKLWQEAQADPLSFHKFGKAEKHPFIAALADYGLNIQEFFVADPRVAMLLRDIASAKALHSVKVMDELLNKVALVSGTVEEINQVSGLNKELRALSEQHEAISKEIEQLLNDMHGHPPDVQEVFQKRLEKLKTDRQRIAFKMAELSEKKAAVHPLAAVDADVAGQVVFSKKDARLLIDKNPTLADIIELDPDKPFAKLDTGKLSVLEGTGVRVGIFDKEVLQYLDGYFSKLSHSGPLEQFFRTFFDPLQRLWATAALFTMPKALRFVTRNVFSDVTRLWLAGVKADSMLEAWRLLGDEATKFLQLRDPFLLKKIREHVFVGNFGQSATFEELWGEFVNRGGISGGLFINEFAKGIPDDVWEKLIDNGVHPSMMALAPLAAQRGVRGSLAKVGKSILYKGGVRLTTATETINRFAAFLHYWKETGDIEKAMLGMKAVMYDYHNLTAFERQVVKRLIPFWAWMRNNIPFMAKMYVLEPVKLVQYRRAWEAIQKGAGGALTPEEIPPYLKNVWGVTVLRRYGKVYWMIQDNLLPQSDIVQLFNPGGWSDYLFQSLSPFAKIAYEVATGRSSLTGRELFLFASQPARSGTLSTLGATAGPTVHGPLGPFNLVWNELLSRHVPSFSALVRAVDSLTGKVTSRGDKLPPELLLLDLMLASVLVLQPGKLQALFEYRKRELTSKARQVLKQGIRHNNSLMQQWAREKLRQIYFTTDLYSLEGLPK